MVEHTGYWETVLPKASKGTGKTRLAWRRQEAGWPAPWRAIQSRRIQAIVPARAEISTKRQLKHAICGRQLALSHAVRHWAFN